MKNLNRFVGAKITNIVRICDMIKFDFLLENQEICLHVQSALTRIFKDSELIAVSNDMFIPSKNFKRRLFKKFKWDEPNSTLFDDQLKKVREQIYSSRVNDITYIKNDKLVLSFENGMKVEVLINTLENENEVFRSFIKGDLESHVVVET